MKKQLNAIVILLAALLLTIAYGNGYVFDFDLMWRDIFVILGLAGAAIMLKPEKKE